MHVTRLPRPIATRTSLLFMLVTVAIAGAAAAQTASDFRVHPDYTVRQWTIHNGLPSNTVKDILQTSDGYLWVATIEGVVRFDGQQYTIYNATNTPGLSSNRISDLAEGPPGHLWITAEPAGLTHYHDGIFTRVEVEDKDDEFVHILSVEGDTVWMSTQHGLARSVGDQMQPYQGVKIPYGPITHVRDETGRHWLGTLYGDLYRLDVDGTLHHFTAENGLPTSNLTSMMLDPAGRLWVTFENNLVRITGDRVEVIPHPQHQWPHQVEIQYVNAGEGVWVSSEGEGWWRFSSSGRPTLLAVSAPGKQPSAVQVGPDRQHWRIENQGETQNSSIFREDERIFDVHSFIETMVFDRWGGLWVGTSQQGLFYISKAIIRTLSVAEGLPDGNVYPIFEDRQGRLWIGTFGNGLVRLEQGRMHPVPTGSVGYMLSLYQTHDGTIWAGQYGPVCEVRDDRCVDVDLFPGQEDRGVRAMYEDRRGRFWLAGHNGLAFGYGEGDKRKWQVVHSADGLPSQPVRAILETRAGQLLFGTNGNGVLRYDESGSFETLTTVDGLASDNVRDLYEDTEGYLWIVLEDRGLCRLDRGNSDSLKARGVACIDTRGGMHWDGLHRLIEDDQGRFWFNSNNGIFWVERTMLMAFFNGETTAVTPVNYGEADGMRNPEGNGGSQPAGIKASDGRLWFPTQDGVVVIDPASVPVPGPPVHLVAVQVGKETRALTSSLALKASERDVSIQFTAIEFSQPEDVRFQYRLRGYDETWYNAGAQRLINYTNLPAGNFTFEVRAALGSNWGKASALDIERAPFFWERWWFYGLVGLFFVVVGSTGYVLRVRQMRAREAALEQIVAERTAELADKARELEHANALKSRFLANISHEFRTPLTLTFGPLDDIAKGRFSSLDEVIPHAERARRNGARLLRLINQLLDLSRLDAGALLLRPQRLDLAELLRQIAAMFESMAHHRGLSLSLNLPEAPVYHVFDPDKVEKVVVNLLSNAFKFTPQGGKISLSLDRVDERTVRITLADTGVGIAKEHLPYLFDRFYQVEGSSTRKHEGSGIGLALVKELVELHAGEIEVESTVGFGTRFTITLPMADWRTWEDDAETGTSLADAFEPIEIDTRLPDVVVMAERSTPPELSSSAIDETMVLLIEDNADMRAYIRAHLADHFSIVEAENGKIGVERAKVLVPDLVLSDVMMPEMDGLEVCQALKTDVRTSHIPVVLLTAKAAVEHRIAGFESGADAYLPKPFNAEELQVRVRTLIEERRRLRARFAGSEPTARNGAEEAAEALPPREAAFLNEVSASVAAGLGDAQFGVEALAEAMSMSRRQLHRKLQALQEESPSDMIRRMRLEQAAMLLRAGELSVKEIGYQVGFRSDSSFTHVFRQTYGVPPSEYARRVQEKV